MSASNYLEEKVLKHIFDLAAYAAPGDLFVALSTANPGEDGSGLAEPAGGSYARVATDAGDWTWNGGASRVENGNDVAFPTASAAWGTATHFAIYDDAVAGNLIFYAPLAASKSIGNGDTATFPAGTLTVTAD